MIGVRSLIRNFSLRSERVWLGLWGTGTYTGKPVNPDTAMQVATVWACVGLIAQTISTLPLGVFRRTDAGEREAVSDHPMALLLRLTPNADQTPSEFLEGVVACLLLYGNAFAEKTVSAGQVRALTILHPALMAVERLENGTLRYTFSGPHGRRVYGEDEVWHLRGFGLGGDVGMSPIAYARETIGTARATDEAAARTFANGMRPSGFLVYNGPKLLTDEQREQARKVLIEPYSGVENTGRTGILEGAGGFSWQSVSLPSKDQELLASRAWHVEEICRWYRVPPILVGHSPQGQTMWGSGIEQVILGWLTLGLRPLLTKIEQSINRSLVAPGARGTVYAEFNVEGLLRADSKGRAEMYSKMLQAGAITPNEIRDKENFPRFDGGDVHLINSTLIPLDQAGKRPGRVQAAPGEPVPEAA